MAWETLNSPENAINPTARARLAVDDKIRGVSGYRRAALSRRWRRQGATIGAGQDITEHLLRRQRQRQSQRRQGRTEIVGSQTEFADMRRQNPFPTCCMLDSMRSGPDLGEKKQDDEKKARQVLHGSQSSRGE
jgi:hypothetical protein